MGVNGTRAHKEEMNHAFGALPAILNLSLIKLNEELGLWADLEETHGSIRRNGLLAHVKIEMPAGL
jgi:hypothetical protein